MRAFRYSPAAPRGRAFTIADAIIVVALVGALYAAARWALAAPRVLAGPQISLSRWALPWYALLSLGRMAAAYALSLSFSLVYGYAAARNATARAVLLPLLDILQSVPILSFLPVVVLALTAVLPRGAAVEIASIVLIFTSQVWNMTFSFYQSMTTVPMELREAAAVFRLGRWQRFCSLELPCAAQGLVWNSMMSWSGGWFFLMAAEIFHAGARDFRLPGLGAYLQTAADAGDVQAVVWGAGVLLLVIVLLDQCVWRPVLVWADRFRIETVEGEDKPSSWFLGLMSQSFLLRAVRVRRQDETPRAWAKSRPASPVRFIPAPEAVAARRTPAAWIVGGLAAALAAYGAWRAAVFVSDLPAEAWGRIGVGLAATFGRVWVSLAIALAWTVPVGVAIGTHRRLADTLQPLAQIAAAVPATALFPILLLGLLRAPGGLNLAAVALMLMGAQWYLLFNVIAGTAAIPQDLRQTTDMLRLSRAARWRTLLLPALFPYIVTGAITAAGGAWNASIVAERVQFAGQTHAVRGIGALIAGATAADDHALLFAGTVAMVLTVVFVNRFFWRRLYRVAEERYRLE